MTAPHLHQLRSQIRTGFCYSPHGDYVRHQNGAESLGRDGRAIGDNWMQLGERNLSKTIILTPALSDVVAINRFGRKCAVNRWSKM
jgi:hypothetical protein